MQEINIDTWDRKIQFDFFKDFDDPFFNLVAQIDVSPLLKYCKKKGLSFFLASLHFSGQAVNAVQGMRLRMKDDKVYDFDTIHIGSTVFRPNKTFSFAHFPFKDSLQDFCLQSDKIAKKQIETGGMEDPPGMLNVVYYSVVPWVHFMGLKHPRKKDQNDSVPRIVFGKYIEHNGKWMMPVSVDVHHALADGYHVGQYFIEFQQRIDNLE
jgi:chloramphenicol O-acetyltransferase type A